METVGASEGIGSEIIGISRKGVKRAGESLLSSVLVMHACVLGVIGETGLEEPSAD